MVMEVEQIEELISILEQDIKALKLVKDLLDPEMYGYAVSAEVRNAAREVLGIQTREPV